jgi:hypothetical protein
LSKLAVGGIPVEKAVLTKSRTITKLAILLVVGLLGLAAVAFSSFIYGLSDLYGTFHYTSHTADFNQDGKLDVLVHQMRQESELTWWGGPTVWLNQGDGRFMQGDLPEMPPFLYHDTAPADLDGDGDPDLVILGPNMLSYQFNQGGMQAGQPGEFKLYGAHVQAPSDHGIPGSLALGDLTGNGYPDSFAAGCCSWLFPTAAGRENIIPSYSWSVLYDNNPDGYPRSTPVSYKSLGSLRIKQAALGDLDGDGDLDVFTAILRPKVGSETGHPNLILLNDGQGNLSDSGQRLGNSSSTSVALQDLDGDGDLDALVGNIGGWEIWLNQGGLQGGEQGLFSAGQEFNTTPVKRVFLADFDNDGDFDALIAGERQAAIWLNDGAGNFSRSRQSLRYSHRYTVAVGDFNGDGLADVFSNSYQKAYRVWFNRGDGTFR